MKEQIEYEGNISEIQPKKENHHVQYRLSINDEHMSKRLVELGVVNNKSLILKFPTEEQCPAKFLSHFVRGYFDGDGHVGSFKGKYNKFHTSTVGTKEFLSGISEILSSLNIRHNIRHPKQSGESNTFILSTSANNSSYQFLHWMYQDAEMKMERKYQRYLQLCEQCNLVA
jgi:intein-encoded DNA endonuclease-like protein